MIRKIKKILIFHLMILISGAFPVVVLNCHGSSKKKQEQKLERYSGSEKTFELTIPGEHTVKETRGEESRTVELSVADEEGVTSHIIRVKITEGLRDLYDPGYESSYLSGCKCSIIERGSVNFAGRPARHYMVSLRNGEWIGLQRHFAGKNKMFVLSVNGPKDSIGTLRILFEQVTAGFQLLEK